MIITQYWYYEDLNPLIFANATAWYRISLMKAGLEKINVDLRIIILALCK